MGITAFTEQKADTYIEVLAEALRKCVYGETTTALWQELLEQALHKAFPGKELPEPIFIKPSNDQLFLMNAKLDETARSMKAQETASLRQAAAFLEEMIEKRTARGEVWLEGMLELGVARLALGEHDQAERVLSRLVRLCESGGELSEERLMAA
jgi:hypothetical protein